MDNCKEKIDLGTLLGLKGLEWFDIRNTWNVPEQLIIPRLVLYPLDQEEEMGKM